MGFVSSRLLGRRVGITIVLGLALHSFVHEVPRAWAQSSQGATEPKRPAYQLGSAGRFNEDWSSVWLSLGGQVRERGEYFRHFLFGASEPKDSDGYLLSRFRL